MDRVDANKLAAEEQYQLRRQVVRLREKGMPNNKVAELLGLSQAHCSRIWTVWRKEGPSSIAKKPHGRKVGEKEP